MPILRTASEQSSIIIVALHYPALDRAHEQGLQKLLVPLLKPNLKLLLDVSAVHSADSYGIRALMRLTKQIHALDGELKLCGLSQPLRELFQVLRLHHVLEIYNNVAEAERSFRLQC